jgi:hypothetical protein
VAVENVSTAKKQALICVQMQNKYLKKSTKDCEEGFNDPETVLRANIPIPVGAVT